jgi:hypothetical protein
MNMSTNQTNFAFRIENRESFDRDIKELVDAGLIIKSEVDKNYDKLVEKINNILLSCQDQSNIKKKYPIYEELKNRYEFSINDQKFNFEFFFDTTRNVLVFLHFDKLIEDKEVTTITDFTLFFLALLVNLIFVIINKPPLFSFISILVLPVINIFLFIFVCYNSKKRKNYTIWVNQNSIDQYRKLFRARTVSDLNKIYYFVSWLNLWIFCLILVAIFTGYNGSPIEILVSPVVLLGTVIIMFYSLGYLLKMFRMTYWNVSILSILLFLIGFLNKDNWAFIALVFVIVNQLLSKDILFLSNTLTPEEIQKIETSLDTYTRKADKIRLTFQTNIVIVGVYLFIIIFNKSLFLVQFIQALNPYLKLNCTIITVITGIERLIFLVLFVFSLKTDIHWVVERKNKLINQFHSLVDYISDKLYRNKRLAEPTFREEFYVFPDEQISPKDLIVNLTDLPSDIKMIWQSEPGIDWKTDPNQTEFNSELLIIYPDRTYYKGNVLLKKKLI